MISLKRRGKEKEYTVDTKNETAVWTIEKLEEDNPLLLFTPNYDRREAETLCLNFSLKRHRISVENVSRGIVSIPIGLRTPKSANALMQYYCGKLNQLSEDDVQEYLRKLEYSHVNEEDLDDEIIIYFFNEDFDKLFFDFPDIKVDWSEEQIETYADEVIKGMAYMTDTYIDQDNLIAYLVEYQKFLKLG